MASLPRIGRVLRFPRGFMLFDQFGQMLDSPHHRPFAQRTYRRRRIRQLFPDPRFARLVSATPDRHRRQVRFNDIRRHMCSTPAQVRYPRQGSSIRNNRLFVAPRVLVIRHRELACFVCDIRVQVTDEKRRRSIFHEHSDAEAGLQSIVLRIKMNDAAKRY